MGYDAEVVEKYNSFTKQRKDVAGCIDILAWQEGYGAIGVQACAGSSHSARRAKALAEPRLRKWLASGLRFAVFSWSKKGAKGKRKTWQCRVDEVSLSDLG